MFVRRLIDASLDDDSVRMKLDERKRVARRLDDAVKRNVRDALANAETAFVQVPGEKRFNARMTVENFQNRRAVPSRNAERRKVNVEVRKERRGGALFQRTGLSVKGKVRTNDRFFAVLFGFGEAFVEPTELRVRNGAVPRGRQVAARKTRRFADALRFGALRVGRRGVISFPLRTTKRQRFDASSGSTTVKS